MVKFIGESLALAGAGVNGDTHIATAFPRAGVIVTVPGIHATQREAYLEQLERTRRAEGLPAISDAEAERLLEETQGRVIHAASSKKRKKENAKPGVDAMAAALILKEYLDRRQAVQDAK